MGEKKEGGGGGDKGGGERRGGPPQFLSTSRHGGKWYFEGFRQQWEIETSFNIFLFFFSLFQHSTKNQIENETFRLHPKQSKTSLKKEWRKTAWRVYQNP